MHFWISRLLARFVWYWCHYPHRSRDALSPVWIFFLCIIKKIILKKYIKWSYLPSNEKISWNGHKWISEYIWMPNYVPNKYLNIFGCIILYQTNIQIFSDATYLPNNYLNIFVRLKFAQIQIQIIFECNCIQIFEYS